MLANICVWFRSAAELPSSFSEDDDETADSTSAEE